MTKCLLFKRLWVSTAHAQWRTTGVGGLRLQHGLRTHNSSFRIKTSCQPPAEVSKMSFQKLSKYGSVLCGKHDHVARILRSEAESLQGKQVSSVVSGHRNSHSSAGSRQQLRIEGIQGPIPAQLSANESKRLLESASIQAAGGFSKRGVQDCQLHTDQVHHSSASHSYRATDWELDDTACPQGVQGSADLGAGCAHFNTWLENCRRYGLANCDQQLQGIQSGRLTLAQVLADQEVMITEIAESYRKRTEELPDVADESMQGAQGQLRLPEVSAPCPQGIQGDDCVRFKLWLENCHRFGIHECMQQLQGFQSGRLTLAQLFIQQDAMIRQVAQQYQQRRQYSTQPRGDNSNATSTTTDAQVGDATTTQQLSQAEKLKRAVKEYGSTVIVFHITISLASLGGFYLAVSSGIDMVGILKSVGVGEAILQSKLATGTGTFVVAYAVHKVFAPVRIGITLTSTPFIVRYLRSKGFLKAPKKSS